MKTIWIAMVLNFSAIAAETQSSTTMALVKNYAELEAKKEWEKAYLLRTDIFRKSVSLKLWVEKMSASCPSVAKVIAVKQNYLTKQTGKFDIQFSELYVSPKGAIYKTPVGQTYVIKLPFDIKKIDETWYIQTGGRDCSVFAHFSVD